MTGRGPTNVSGQRSAIRRPSRLRQHPQDEQHTCSRALAPREGEGSRCKGCCRYSASANLCAMGGAEECGGFVDLCRGACDFAAKQKKVGVSLESTMSMSMSPSTVASAELVDEPRPRPGVRQREWGLWLGAATG
nr:hypothetical protein CFP56_04228 [Quercus suber]